MYLRIVCENMNVFVCGHMHESIVTQFLSNFCIKLALYIVFPVQISLKIYFLKICRMYLIIVDNEYASCLLYCYKSF